MEPMDDWDDPIYPPRTKMRMGLGKSAARTMWEGFADAVGQFKLKGSRNMTVIRPSGTIEMWNRGDKGIPPAIHKQYKLTAAMEQQIRFLNIPKGKLTVLDSELIHAKMKDIKDVLYLFDVLVYDGMYLLGQDYKARYELLEGITPHCPLFPLDCNAKEGTIYRAQNLKPDKWEWVCQLALEHEILEGLVLKRTGPISRLARGNTVINNEFWMARVRKPSENYN